MFVLKSECISFSLSGCLVEIRLSSLLLFFAVASFPSSVSSPSFLHLFLLSALGRCSRGVISGMLRLRPFLVRMAFATCSASSSSSSDHVFSSCRLLREPPKLPFPRFRVRNLDRNVTKERLLLRCFSQRFIRSWSSVSPWSSSRPFLRTVRNSLGTSCTSGSTLTLASWTFLNKQHNLRGITDSPLSL